MDYEKKYKEALEKARKELQTCGSIDCDAARQLFRLFPELAKSEDEKIRKDIICYFEHYVHDIKGADLQKWIDWLKKQGESDETKAKTFLINNGYPIDTNGVFPTYEDMYSIIKDGLEKHGEIMDINPSEFDLHLNRLLKQFEALPKEELASSLEFYLNVVQNDGTYKADEKQGEQKHKFIIGDIISNNNVIYRVDNIVKNCIGQDCYFLVNIESEKRGTRYLIMRDSEGKTSHMGEITWLCDQVDAKFEKQGEKLTDKIEPKFHEGEWIVWQDKFYKVNFNGCGYELIDQNGLSTSLEYGTIDENAHLWTISDAKAGDVLYCKADNGIEYFVMNKGINKCGNIDSYFRYNSLDDFGVDILSVLSIKYDNITPATKEQRDTLEKAMTDAGWEFDFEKKQLKKLGQQEVIKISDQVGCEANFTTTKEWSEEDEKMLNDAVIAVYAAAYYAYSDRQKIENWLKSLKQRIKE